MWRVPVVAVAVVRVAPAALEVAKAGVQQHVPHVQAALAVRAVVPVVLRAVTVV